MHPPFDPDFPYAGGARPARPPVRDAPSAGGDEDDGRISGDGSPGPDERPWPPPQRYVPTWHPNEPEDTATYGSPHSFAVEGAPRAVPGRPEPAASSLPAPRAAQPPPAGVPAWQPLSRTGSPDPPPYAPPAAPVAAPARKPLYPRPTPTEPREAFHDALEVMRRGKWHFLLCLVLTLGAVGAYVHVVPSEYEASTLLLLDTREERPGSGLAFDGSQDPAFETRKLSNQALILGQSLTLAERTADRLIALRTDPTTGAPLHVLEAGGAPVTKAALAKDLQEHYVLVEPAAEKQDADGIWVHAVSASPHEAALIANLFAEEYVTLARETGRKHVIASRAFLEAQIERRHAELTGLEQQIRDYQRREGAVSLSDEAQRSIAQIAQLEAALDQAEVEISMHEASLGSLEDQLHQLQPRLTQRVASGVELEIAKTQQEIVVLEDRVAQIYQRNPELRGATAGQPDLAQLNGQIAQLRARVDQLSAQYVDEVFAAGGIDPRSEGGGLSQLSELKRRMAEERVAHSGAQARVRALRERLADYNRRLVSIPAQSMELAQLERTRLSTEQLYLALVQKLQEARIAEESEVGFAQVIRPATAPEDPARPDKPLSLVLGGVLGVLVGVGAAVGRHKLDTRLYTPADLRAKGFNLLGVIPDMRRTARKAHGGQRKVTLEWREVSTNLMSLLSPRSAEAEAYRRLHTALAFAPAGSGAAQAVLVTSPEMGAGKSVTAVNLAVTAAHAGHRVLLVDADLHRPSLAGYLGYMPPRELGRMVLEQRARISIDRLATGVPNLYALSLHDPAVVPAELLGSPRMRGLIARFRGVFDLIVFDSPPALVAADAALLAASCDATLVVTAAGQTRAEDVHETLDELGKVGAHIAGLVLNRFDFSRVFGYKKAYKYRYRYYDQSRSSRRA